MKQIVYTAMGICLLFLFSACREEHVAPVNQLVKDLFCFKEGSEWIYYDSVSRQTAKMSISNYRTLKAASTPKGGQKAYDFAEHIEIKGIFFSEFEVNIEAQGDGEDNTAVFKSHFYGGDPYPYENRISLPLYFRCDANNNFSCTVTYYETCNVAGHTYKEVYLFERDNIKFYTAKYIGFIRIIKSDSQCDFVLIDKNIVQ